MRHLPAPLAVVVVAAVAATVGHVETAAADVVEGPRVHWNHSAWGNPRAANAYQQGLEEYLKERTDGQFTYQIHWGTLSQPRAVLDGISLGAFQAGTYCIAYYPGRMPAATGMDLPFLPIETLAELANVTDDYYAHPTVAEEFDRWDAKYFMSSILPLYEVVGKGKPPQEIEDWKGMRIRAPGALGEAFRLLGAVPTNVPAPEVYTALDRGLVDAAGFAYYAHMSYRTFELADWHTHGFRIGSVSCGTTFNKNAWNDLPPQYQELLEEYRPIGYAMQIEALNQSETVDGPKIMEENGLTRIDIDAETRRRFAETSATPVWENWMKQMDGHGYDGQDLLDTILESADRHQGASF